MNEMKIFAGIFTALPLPDQYRRTVSALALIALTVWVIVPSAASAHTYGQGYGGDGQYSCDSNRGTFTLLTLDEAPPRGFKTLSKEQSSLVCHLGKRILRAQVAVDVGHGNFANGAFGMVDINSLVIDGVDLLEGPIHFNYPLQGDALVISVRVRVRVREPNVELIECTIPYDDDSAGWPDHNASCKATIVDVDKIRRARGVNSAP